MKGTKEEKVQNQPQEGRRAPDIFFGGSQYSLFHKGFPEFQSRICIRMAGYISMESLLPAKSAPQISPATANWHEGEHNAGETEDTNKEIR